jgi:hypothetical protein
MEYLASLLDMLNAQISASPATVPLRILICIIIIMIPVIVLDYVSSWIFNRHHTQKF